MKALSVAKHLLREAECGGCNDVDCVSLLEIICDYLQANDKTFNENV
jgi:hypothetical protein